METKQIVVYPNDILTTPTKKTDLKTAQELAVELFKTLKQEGGLGLSANQIGEDKSVCVVDVTNPFFLLGTLISISLLIFIIFVTRDNSSCLSVPFIKTPLNSIGC